MMESQYRALMEIVKSPLKDKLGGKMKEETMNRLQAIHGRKARERERQRKAGVFIIRAAYNKF
jgi:hypothetical protein